MVNYDVDITGNIKAIEFLKTELLSNVSALYDNMNNPTINIDNRAEILANIAIINYILARRLGVDYFNLDTKIISKLKLSVLEEKNIMHRDIVDLLKHMDKSN